MNFLDLIGRTEPLLDEDVGDRESELSDIVSHSRFLVLGGAGSIGQSTVKEIFRRNPRALHVVDISENNLVELVRDLRSSFGYIDGDFATFALDIGSIEFEAMLTDNSAYDYVLNLSALKHVRSEKDPYTLMRMIDVNVFNTVKTLRQARDMGAKKYFCISTDKAANPVNMMGGSKRIMEMFLMRESLGMEISMTRFANVAFSDGSLLHGFNQRLLKYQSIVAPNDVRRYFVTFQEAGELCLMSCVFGENRDIFFPKLDGNLDLITFSEIATRYLHSRGYEPLLCSTEDEARARASELTEQSRHWPCLFTASDTTGEKDFEEFFVEGETLDMERFKKLGIVKNESMYEAALLDEFESTMWELKARGRWSKDEIVSLFFKMMPSFGHEEKGKHLDSKM